MRIVYLGSGEFGCPSLEWLIGSGHRLVQVITQPARRAGRGKAMVRTPIAQLAAQSGLDVGEAEDVNEPAVVARIRACQPEVLLVIAFGQKIGTDLLHLPNCRGVNLHGSLLPAYRGAAPINWAIINGERQTGLTIIELNERWDAGAILGQVRTEIRPQETAGELHDRLARMGPGLLEEVLNKIASGCDKPLVQDDSRASRAPKLRKTDGAIKWGQPTAAIKNFIHGIWPWPGAYCYVEQQGKAARERLSIARAEVCEAGTPEKAVVKSGAIPGTIVEDMRVVCGDGGRLRLLEVRPDNGRLMTFREFANGRRLESGDRLADG